MRRNKHNLNRDIPAPIKREVRQRSKFGCVICRCGIYEYEHIIPEFNDAKIHDASKICLLCGQCHNKVTKGMLSKDTVLKKYYDIQLLSEINSPWESFDLNTDNIVIKVGSCIFKYAKDIIKFNNQTILSINPPEDGSYFPTISGIFTNAGGEEIFKINKNEWAGPTKYWDIEVCGKEIVIRSGPRKVALKIKVNPPCEIEIVTLDIKINNCHLLCKNGSFSLGRVGSDFEYYITIEHLESYGADVGILIDELSPKEPKLTAFSIIGNEGINLVGTGIRIAKGAGRIEMRGITIEDATKQRTIRTYIAKNDLSVRSEVLPPRL